MNYSFNVHCMVSGKLMNKDGDHDKDKLKVSSVLLTLAMENHAQQG